MTDQGPRTAAVDLYVPKVGHEHGIIEGSGIVALPRDAQLERFPWVPDGKLLVYFEGNKFGSSSMRTYADRAFHAADRMLWHTNGYPTIAKAVRERDDLLFVGQFHYPDGRLDIGDSEKLAAWLGLDWLPDEELVRTR